MPRKMKLRFNKVRPPDPRSLEAPWRLFVAVPLPEPVLDLVGTVIEKLSADGKLPVRWVNPRQAHVTIQFIGEVPAEQAELVRLALGTAVAKHEVFRLRTADLGVFPNLRRPRVLWLGLYGPVHRLGAIRTDVTRALAGIEVSHDATPYQPHIALGRVRNEQGVRIGAIPQAVRERFDALMAAGLGSMREPVAIPVDEVVLYRSVLDKDGAHHDPVERYALTRRRPDGRADERVGVRGDPDLARVD